MKCPFCSNVDSRVIDSRAMDDGEVIRRRRQCETCNERFTTYERITSIPLIVIKRDETREEFNPEKLLNGIIKSCNKRPVSLKQMENIVSEIENYILNNIGREISTKEIGEMVMAKLKEIDEVAYVRFASVYKQFKDIDTFMEELSKLLEEKKS